MGRKNKRKPMSYTIPSDLILEANKPRFNSHQGGYGAHKSAKDYTRKKKHKKDLR